MNPEAGFALETAEQEPFEAPEPRHLADILQLSSAKIREMPIEELQRLHDEMVPHLSRPEKPSTGFSGYLERLNPTLQKQISKRPELATQHLQTYLETGLTTLRSRVRIEEQSERPAVYREMTGADRRFAATAEQLLEKNFADWTASRAAVDAQGRPKKLSYEDERFVEKIDSQRAIELAKGEEFFELTDRYEVGFATGLTDFEVFGEGIDVRVDPSSKYDDYARGLDMVARIPSMSEDGSEIVLGIDFTITSTDIDIAKKLRRNRSQPFRKTKYATRDLPVNTEYLPVVLAVDRERADRVARYEAIMATAKQYPGGEAVASGIERDVTDHHDRAVFQYAVLQEAIAQLHVQRDELLAKGLEAIVAKYDAALQHLEPLLAARKNLQAQAELETKQREAVYRITDESFIRTAPDLVAGAAVSRAA